MARIRYRPVDPNPRRTDRELLLLVLDTCERLDERADRLECLIDGNGQPGLITRLARVEGAQDTAKARTAATGGLGGVIGVMLATILAKLGLHL